MSLLDQEIEKSTAYEVGDMSAECVQQLFNTCVVAAMEGQISRASMMCIGGILVAFALKGGRVIFADKESA